jgi:arylformamidase
MKTNKRWIDVSVPIYSGMVHWPDNPPVEVRRLKDMDRDPTAHCNVSAISMGSHTGTHMDAPLHFIRNGKPLDKMPLDATVGPARVAPIQNRTAITVAELEPLRLKAGERILFKTLNSKRSWKTDAFDENFVYINQEAAAFLAQKKVRTVGVDYLSVGGYKKDGRETHHALLRAGIWIIEGLNLSKIQPGTYDLICLPLKVMNADGAPARAILSPRGRAAAK